MPRMTSQHWILLGTLGAAMMNGSADAHDTRAPLTGDWAGNQARLSASAEGGRLDLSCASASIDTPIRPDAAGTFTTTGRYEAFDGGPTPADRAPASVPARFAGRLEGDTLHLSVERIGAPAEHYTLERGRRIKLIRCQ